jgi:hypothetical protein
MLEHLNLVMSNLVLDETGMDLCESCTKVEWKNTRPEQADRGQPSNLKYSCIGADWVG